MTEAGHSTVPRLRSLARLYGVQTWYTDAGGERRDAGMDTLLATLRALGAPVAGASDVPAALEARAAELRESGVEPVHVAWDGHLAGIRLRAGIATGEMLQLHLRMEDGAVRSWTAQPEPIREAAAPHVGRAPARLRLDCDMPLGYHQLEIETPDRTLCTSIIAAPRRAHLDEGRHWGVFCPLYAVQSARSWGVGDYTLLAELLEWTAAHGGRFVGTLPLLAGFLDAPFDPSPYSPASRLFWNELYLDAERLPGGALGPGADVTTEWSAVRADAPIDYARVAALKRTATAAAADHFFAHGGAEDAAYLRFLGERPDAREYARFRAVGERQRTGWPAWPERLRNREIRPDDYDAAAERYHLYAQYAADRQLAETARRATAAGAHLYLDMPIGVHGDSFDVWRQPHLFARGASAGAPPDALFSGGQDWGFPPLDPHAVRQDGYQYIVACIRHHLRYAGVLRLDHVMALRRLYWVPSGFSARDGAYVRYPQDEWLAVLTLESVRHRATIIGEDLGTVPAEVREAMHEHGVQRMHVVQFEASADAEPPIPAPPRPVVASLNTHDMPPFAAYWQGTDIADQRTLGLTDEEGVRTKTAARARLRSRVAAHLRLPHAAARADCAALALPGLIAHLARSPARAVLLNLEDLWLETRPQNVPGTSTERPNWRRRMRLDFEQLTNSGDIRTVLQAVDRMRAESGE